jgi:hypothetical protein
VPDGNVAVGHVTFTLEEDFVMSTTLLKRPLPAADAPSVPSPSMFGPVAAPELTGELERLRVEEQERIDRERQEAIARLQELARFD